MIMYALYAFHAQRRVNLSVCCDISWIVCRTSTEDESTLKYILLFMARTGFEAIELLIDYLPAYTAAVQWTFSSQNSGQEMV